jgi:hypothetical protein
MVAPDEADIFTPKRNLIRVKRVLTKWRVLTKENSTRSRLSSHGKRFLSG